VTVAAFEKMFLDQVSDDFGVSLGGELVAFVDQFFLQTEIVFDDAVMYDDDFAAAVAMRMSVFFRGTPVRGPAGVADAIAAVQRFEADGFFQVAQLAFRTAHLATCPRCRQRRFRQSRSRGTPDDADLQ